MRGRHGIFNWFASILKRKRHGSTPEPDKPMQKKELAHAEKR